MASGCIQLSLIKPFSVRMLVAYTVGFEGNSGVRNKETISYQKEKCNVLCLAHKQHMPTDVLNIRLLHFPSDKTLFPCFLHHYCLQIIYATNFLI